MATVITLEAPCFLLAVPQMGDRHFDRTVVFLLKHDDRGGSMGLILNRPADVDMTTFLRSVQMRGHHGGQHKIFNGGPVQTDRAFLLHVSEHVGPETEEVTPQMKLSYSLESLKMLVEAPPAQMRVYLGYAGWEPSQLAREISCGAWLVAPATAKLVFDTPFEKIWDTTLRDLGIEPGQIIHSRAIH